MDNLIANLKDKLDMIIHLAANCSTPKSIENPKQDFNDNALATFKICEISRKLNVPVIFTSSCKVHPNKRGERAPYGLSKYVGELYLKEYKKMYGTKFIINRPGTLYGPGQEGSPESGWLSWFIKAKRENLPITIFGDGTQSRDVLFISDYVNLLIDQIEHFGDYEREEPYEVGGGIENEITLLKLLEFLEYKDYNFDSERKGDVKRFVSDNKDISSVKNWRPLVLWQEGVKQTLNSISK